MLTLYRYPALANAIAGSVYCRADKPAARIKISPILTVMRHTNFDELFVGDGAFGHHSFEIRPAVHALSIGRRVWRAGRQHLLAIDRKRCLRNHREVHIGDAIRCGEVRGADERRSRKGICFSSSTSLSLL